MRIENLWGCLQLWSRPWTWLLWWHRWWGMQGAISIRFFPCLSRFSICYFCYVQTNLSPCSLKKEKRANSIWCRFVHCTKLSILNAKRKKINIKSLLWDAFLKLSKRFLKTTFKHQICNTNLSYFFTNVCYGVGSRNTSERTPLIFLQTDVPASYSLWPK